MERNRISSMISGTIMASFIFMMAGFEAYPQSHTGAADSGSQIRENKKMLFL